MKLKLTMILASLLYINVASAQDKIIDRNIATVGSQILLQSDLENQYMQYLQQGGQSDEQVRCQMLDQLLLQKMLIHIAGVDSVVVSENQVDEELDKRIKYFVKQIGSQEKLEEYYSKSIIEIKAEFRELIRDQLLVQTMHDKITRNVSVSPAQVRLYFDNIPTDSVPFIDSELEVAQITKLPKVSPEDKKLVTDRLQELRQRILKGENFATLAVLYSQDPGSAKKGGELGFTSRGELLPEFEAVSFNLKGDEVSRIVETKYGFHIIQAIERRGDQINFRHILMKASVSSASLASAKSVLDSALAKIQSKELSFAEAAQQYSDDKDSRYSGGVLINPQTGQTKFEPSQLDPTLFFVIDKLKPGEYSEPVVMNTDDGTKAYRIVMLKTKTDPHRANLKDDYQRIKEAALSEKQSSAIEEWILKRKTGTYIQIDNDFTGCNVVQAWLN